MKTTFRTSAVVLILLLAATVLSATMKSVEQGGYDWLKARLEASKAYTLEVLQAMPADDYDYKPNDEQRTFAAQAYHIAYSMDYFHRAFSNGGNAQWNPGDENSKTKDELIKWVTEKFDEMNAFILSQDLDNGLTAGVIFYLDHNAHHRGQIVTYLRMKGITPPNYR